MFSRTSASSDGKRSKGNGLSVLGSDVRLIGNLESEGDIHIDGAVEGDIRARGVVVSQVGKVKGEIAAEAVRVHGRVEGRIKAGSVSLGRNAHVVADIDHEFLDVEKGAFFDGHCRRLAEARKDNKIERDGAEPKESPVALVVSDAGKKALGTSTARS